MDRYSEQPVSIVYVEDEDYVRFRYIKDVMDSDGEHVVAVVKSPRPAGGLSVVYTLAVDTKPEFTSAEMCVPADVAARQAAAFASRSDTDFPFGVLHRLRVVNRSSPVDVRNICDVLTYNAMFSVTAAVYPTRSAALQAAAAPFSGSWQS